VLLERRHAEPNPPACEHAFVTSQGTAHGRFTRAIERRQLRGAEMAARELGRLSPADALALVLLIREQAPHRSERAAARWVSLFLDAAGSMTLADIELTVVSLGALNARVVVGVRCTRVGCRGVSRAQRRRRAATTPVKLSVRGVVLRARRLAHQPARVWSRRPFRNSRGSQRALAEVEPDLEPFLSVEAVPLRQTPPNWRRPVVG
jgi:hypothetical protein